MYFVVGQSGRGRCTGAGNVSPVPFIGLASELCHVNRRDRMTKCFALVGLVFPVQVRSKAFQFGAVKVKKLGRGSKGAILVGFLPHRTCVSGEKYRL